MIWADPAPPLEPRIRHWLACPEKSCCSNAAIPVFGDEVVTVARTLRVEPVNFVDGVEMPPGVPGSFALDLSEKRYLLVLRRDAFPGHEFEACTFLIEAGGSPRCGLAELRPSACRLVPFSDDFKRHCTCDWSGVPLDDDAGEIALIRASTARDVYAEHVDRWNAYVAQAAETQPFTFLDFLRYLLDVYS